MQTLLRKWWVLILQGILLIVLGIFFFNHPMEVLAAVSFWVALFMAGSGVLGILAWFSSDKDERETGILVWSVLTAIVGVLMMAQLGIAAKTITVILGLWVIVTGIWLLRVGWGLRQQTAIGYLIALIGLLAAIAGVAILFDLHKGAIWISSLLGLEAILVGIALIALGFFKKNVKGKIVSAAETIRNR